MTRLQSAGSRGCTQRCFQLPLVLMMAPPAVRATGVNDDYASLGFKQKRQDSYPVRFFFFARKHAVALCTTFLHRSKHAFLVFSTFSFNRAKCNQSATKIPRNNSCPLVVSRTPWDHASGPREMVPISGGGIN